MNKPELHELWDMLDTAWGIIANAYGGDWNQATEASGWKHAAEQWRDRWHDLLRSQCPTRPDENDMMEKDRSPIKQLEKRVQALEERLADPAGLWFWTPPTQARDTMEIVDLETP